MTFCPFRQLLTLCHSHWLRERKALLLIWELLIPVKSHGLVKNFRDFPLSNPTQSFAIPSILWNDAMTMTTTSLSMVFMRILRKLLAACLVWSSILSSASSTLHGMRSSSLTVWLLMTLAFTVAITSLAVCALMVFSERKGNNSFLLSLQRRNVPQLLGKISLVVTLRRTRKPRFLRVPALSLFSNYLS